VSTKRSLPRTPCRAVRWAASRGAPGGSLPLAHAQLDHVSPAVGSTVASSPESVALYFTERLEPRFSGGEVRGPGRARVDHGSSVSGNVMRLSVGSLHPGRYSVTWHTFGARCEVTSRLSARFKE